MHVQILQNGLARNAPGGTNTGKKCTNHLTAPAWLHQPHIMSTYQDDKLLSLHTDDNEEKEEKLSIQEKMQALRIGKRSWPADERVEPKGSYKMWTSGQENWKDNAIPLHSRVSVPEMIDRHSLCSFTTNVSIFVHTLACNRGTPLAFNQLFQEAIINRNKKWVATIEDVSHHD